MFGSAREGVCKSDSSTRRSDFVRPPVSCVKVGDMPAALPHLVADDVARKWAGRGGPPTEYAIACGGGTLLGLASMDVSAKWTDEARRGGLGALARATGCETFGYVADSHVTIDGRPTEGLLCLELAIVDFGERAADAAAYFARYTRQKRRFGHDAITIQPMERLESETFGDLARHLMLTWEFVGDPGRVKALKILSGMNAHVDIVDRALQQEIAGLMNATD